MAVFHESNGGIAAGQETFWPLNKFAVAEKHKGAGSQRCVVAGLSYVIGAGGMDIEDVVRTVKYAGSPMTSLGCVPFNDVGGGWTELFGILDVPSGEATISFDIDVDGYFGNSPWYVRGSSVAYTGVDGFGTVVTEYGSGTSLSMAATGAGSTKVVQAFGARAGLSTYNRTQRYLGTAGVSLVMGDMDGTGSSANFTATRAASGAWSGVSVVLLPADIVGSVKPIVAEPAIRIAGRRLPRPGTNRRTVFTVPVEA